MVFEDFENLLISIFLKLLIIMDFVYRIYKYFRGLSVDEHGSHVIISNQVLSVDAFQNAIHKNASFVVLRNTLILDTNGSKASILQIFLILAQYEHLERCIIDCSRCEYSDTIISKMGKEFSNNFQHMRAIHFYGLQNFNLLKLYAFVKENTGIRLKFVFQNDFVLPDELKRDFSTFFKFLIHKPEGSKPEVTIPGYNGAEYLEYVQYFQKYCVY